MVLEQNFVSLSNMVVLFSGISVKLRFAAQIIGHCMVPGFPWTRIANRGSGTHSDYSPSSMHTLPLRGDIMPKHSSSACKIIILLSIHGYPRKIIIIIQWMSSVHLDCLWSYIMHLTVTWMWFPWKVWRLMDWTVTCLVDGCLDWLIGIHNGYEKSLKIIRNNIVVTLNIFLCLNNQFFIFCQVFYLTNFKFSHNNRNTFYFLFHLMF